MNDVSGRDHQGGDVQTYEVAHSTRWVKFPRFYEGFDEPIAELRACQNRSLRHFRKNKAHRDADSVDAQPLQTLDIGLSEPALPVFFEDLFRVVRVRLGKFAVGCSNRKSVAVRNGCNRLTIRT